MNSIKVDKSALITILKENRTTHEELYNEAVDGYHMDVCERLEEALRLASCNEKYITNLDMSRPQSHVKDYDKIIGMLELSNETEVELQSHEYDQYVDDEWHWASASNSINTMYANKMSIK